MTRIAVLGANGQVGAEICLLLSAQEGVEVVPISRNPTGSAFLRYRGIRCRHGTPADTSDAARLLGDCDVVLNLARPPGHPRAMIRQNDALIANAAAYSAPGARQIYCSSLSAYWTFRPVTEPARLTAYGWEKRIVERMVRSHAARYRKEAWILRLGHVAGELQNITGELRRVIRAGAVVAPWGAEHPSNVTFTATIVDAVLAIAAGRENAGIYDLVCSPPWSWRRVLEHEAKGCSRELVIEEPIPPIDQPRRSAASWPGWLYRISASARQLTTTIRSREIGMIALNYLSPDLNLRVQTSHFRRRARAEIQRLRRRPPSAEALLFPPAATRFLKTLRPTQDLLADPRFRLPESAPGRAFPSDLPNAATAQQP